MVDEDQSDGSACGMNKILVGMISNLGTNGVDNYIYGFRKFACERAQVDCLCSAYDEKLADDLRKSGSRLFSVCGLKNPVKQYQQAKKLILEEKYDIVYLNISTALAFPVLKAAHDCGVKRILVHSHSSGFDIGSGWKRKLMTLIHQICKIFVRRNATEFLSCSDKAAQWMFPKEVVDSGKVQYIQNVADVSRFSFDPHKREQLRQELNVTNCFVVGMVGNMSYTKNYPFLLEAFALAAQKDAELTLVVLGGGNQREEVEKKISDLALNDRVMLLGQVNAALGYMSAFDLFVMPSRFEGMPIVSVEAQCAGLPCIFSENITRQAKITPCCTFLPIDDPKPWADEILRIKQSNLVRGGAVIDLYPYSVEAQEEAFQSLLEGGRVS